MVRSLLASGTALAVVLTATGALAATQVEPDEVWLDPGYLRLGDALAGTLAEGDSRTPESGLMDRFVLDLEAGTRVEVVMRSPVFDTYLVAGFLGAEGYEQIAYDDDGLGEDLNSRMTFTAAEAGRYEIRAHGFAGHGEGDYTLSIQDAGPPPVSPAAGSLVIGGSATGELSSADAGFEGVPDQRSDDYRFHAEAGEIVQAVARSSEIDTTLAFYSDTRWGQREMLVFDDDGLGDATNSRARMHVESTGDYIVRVSSYSAGEGGSYQLDLGLVDPWPAPTPIATGETATGAITGTDPVTDDGNPFDAYTFSAQAGQRLEIVAHAGNISTVLEMGSLVGPVGWEAMAYGRETADGVRLLFTPTESGDFVIRVSPAEPAMRGAYSLSVRDRGPLPPVPPPGSISVGDSVAGTLDEGDGLNSDEKYFDEYDLRTAAGERLSITLRSEDLDSFVDILRRDEMGDYATFESDDDSAGNLDSRVSFIADGSDYRIRVTTFSAGEMGRYQLYVRNLGQLASPVPLVIGTPVQNSIDTRDGLTSFESPHDAFSFTGVPERRLRFEAHADAFSPVLMITQSNGDDFDLIAMSDTAAATGSGTARLSFVADGAGPYQLWVLASDPAVFGDYALTSRDLGPPPPPQPIRPGQTLRGTLSDEDGLAYEGTSYDAYAITGVTGQRLRIDLASDAFNTFLLLGAYDVGGLTAIGESDDATGQGTNSSITFTVPTDGNYEVWATSFAVGEAGPYTISLTDLGPEPEPGSLLVGSTVRGSLTVSDPVGPDGSFFDAYRFQATGTRTLRITATSNEFDTYLQLGHMEGRAFVLDQEDDDGLSDLNSLIDFTPDEDSSLTVRVRSFAPGQVGDYVLTVEEVDSE